MRIIRNLLKSLMILLLLSFVVPVDTIAQGKGKGGPPPWAPAHGYRAKTRHVFFPDHNIYFDIHKNSYIFLKGGRWQVSPKLPSIYRGIDLKGATKAELEIDTDSPWKHNEEHLAKYKVKSNGTSVKMKSAPAKTKTKSSPAKSGGEKSGKGKKK